MEIKEKEVRKIIRQELDKIEKDPENHKDVSGSAECAFAREIQREINVEDFEHLYNSITDELEYLKNSNINEKTDIEELDFKNIYNNIKKNNFKLDWRSDDSGDYIILEIDKKIEIILYKDKRLGHLDSWISLL